MIFKRLCQTVAQVIDTVVEKIHNFPNPLLKLRKRFSRYIVITACMGTLSFLVAWGLLHMGIHPLASLIIAALSSGLLSYGAMELWAFPHREGRLSFQRLVQNAVVGIAGFGARYLVLMLGLRYLHPQLPAPLDNAVPLALAYLASFTIGYLVRCRIIFRH